MTSWMRANRCMKRLAVYPRGGGNSAAVDVFDQPHARKVLAEFGRSFGRLPDHLDRASSEQQQFLDVSVLELAENGKVVPVRLAVFASVVRGRPWTRATLKEIRGMEGVGVTFLEATFVAATASPKRRFHERAARGVLGGLLPSEATDLRVCLRSESQLLEAFGYANRRDDFQDLLRILDGQLRLNPSTEPETATEEDAVPSPAGASEKHYQLTPMYAPDDASWATARSAVADHLVSVDPRRGKGWAETLRPVQSELVPPLEQIYRDSNRPDGQRSLAAVVLAMYLGDHPDAMVPLLADAA